MFLLAEPHSYLLLSDYFVGRPSLISHAERLFCGKSLIHITYWVILLWAEHYLYHLLCDYFVGSLTRITCRVIILYLVLLISLNEWLFCGQTSLIWLYEWLFRWQSLTHITCWVIILWTDLPISFTEWLFCVKSLTHITCLVTILWADHHSNHVLSDYFVGRPSLISLTEWIFCGQNFSHMTFCEIILLAEPHSYHFLSDYLGQSYPYHLLSDSFV